MYVPKQLIHQAFLATFAERRRIPAGHSHCVKHRDFDVTDRIIVKLQKHDAVLSAIEHFSDYIKSETLANSLDLIEGLTGGEKVELPGELELGIQVQKA